MGVGPQRGNKSKVSIRGVAGDVYEGFLPGEPQLGVLYSRPKRWAPPPNGLSVSTHSLLMTFLLVMAFPLR